jgi:NADPH:quinone reductase-like Zn-dependent oxidoreductase
MKAIIRKSYGSADVLFEAEVPEPSPRERQVLVRVYAVSINGSDREALTGKPAYVRMGGLRAPRHPILGSDIAGIVEAVGDSVTDFKPGDEVFGELPGYYGGLAEFACAADGLLIRKPQSLTFEDAAAIPQAGVIAYRAIMSKGKVTAGQRVLINGAGGGAGTFAVQLAKLCGAEVTAVDSADKHDLLQSLGADHVIDYKVEDFTRSGTRFDLILDVIASRSVFNYPRVLTRGGTYFCVGGAVPVMLQSLFLGQLIRAMTGRSISVLVVPQNRPDLVAITALCEGGSVRPVIDRVYPFDQARDALRRVAEGSHRGKVVVRGPTVAPA